MKKWMAFIRKVDRIVEITGAIMMAVMVLIVFYQVIARYILENIPPWTQEMALLLMMWYGFLSISIGFRHQLHLRISIFLNMFPQSFQRLMDLVADLLIAAFGVFLIYEGYKFTVLTMDSTLPVTKLPTAIQYIIIPITGVITMLYGLTLIINRKGQDA